MLLNVLMALTVIMITARLVGMLFARLHQPPVMGEVVGGLLLGPSVLGRISPEAAAFLLPPAAAPFLSVIAQLGVILYMFLVGLERRTRPRDGVAARLEGARPPPDPGTSRVDAAHARRPHALRPRSPDNRRLRSVITNRRAEPVYNSRMETLMKRSVLAFAVTAMAWGGALNAQKTTQIKMGDGGSPHVRTDWTVDGGQLSIEYGRPSLKGRAPGKDIDPFPDKEWRTGADEATTLRTDKMLMFGSLHVPEGTYTIYTIPKGGTWHLILSEKTGQWGTPYPGAADDLGRAPMKLSKAPKFAEQLTFSIQDTPSGATLHIDWGDTRASVDFTIG